MDCKKEEARKAIKIAEKKLSKNDYKGAKRFARKAKTLYPTLDGLEQISTMIDVYISSASNKTNGSESDWYGILRVDPLADEEALKKQYKKLALLLHPDKNKFTGATEAFKLISEAWCVLSDKSKRYSYDLKRKSTDMESGMYQKEPKRHKPDFPWKKADFPWNKADFSWNREKDKVGTFWTKCDRCNTYCQFGTDSAYLKRTLSCPNCRQGFVVTEIEFKQKQN